MRNGHGKEYYGDELEFEGEYLNGERNGHGKEYKYKSLIFEGEFKNGKRHGKGKNIKFNHIIFDGKYIEGKKWDGIGFDRDKNLICEFDNGRGFIKENEGFNGAISFEGEFINGEGNGKAKEYNFYGKLIYEGEYLNGKRNGKGKEYYTDKKIKFEGEYLDGKKWNGKMYDITKYKYYTTELKEGKGYLN